MKSFLGKFDFVLAAVVWGIAVGLVVLLFVGPELIGEEVPAQTTTTAATETDDSTTATTTTAAEADGETVFVDNCGTCHTLSAAGTSGTTGPNLDGAGLSADTVSTKVTDGGLSMPSFSGTLDEAEIAAVAAFVAEASAP